MTIYQILTIISALISLALSIYSFKMRKVKSALIFSWLMLFITIFSVGSFFELIARDINSKIAWRNICQIGYLLAVPTLIILILDYIGKESILKPKFIVLIYTFPTLGIILRWTDRYHHLMRKHIFIAKDQLIVISTPFASVIILLEISMVAIAVLILIRFYRKAHKHYRKQMIGMLTGILIPFALEILKMFRHDMIPILPPTSVTISLTGVITFWSIFRYQLFSLVPIARDKIIDSIQEGIITVDTFGIIIDKNKAVDKFIMDISGQNVNILGNNIDYLLPLWPRWFSSCKNMQEDEFEIDTAVWGKKRYYCVKVNPIYGKQLNKRGTVSILFDITERKIREDELLSTADWSKEQLNDLAGELSIQKKQLEVIIDNMSDHCVVVDKEGNYIKVNKAARDFIPSLQGKQVGDWLKVARYYDMKGNEIIADTVPANKVIKGERLRNYRLISKFNDDELHFNVNGVPVYDDNGEFLFGVICSNDITELVQREKEILLQNEQLAAIINNVSDMAILSISDKDGNFLSYSNTANNYFSENTFKVKAGSTYQKGVYFNSDGSEIDQYDMPVFRVLRGEKIINFHFIMRNLKEETHFLFNGTPIINKDGILSKGVFFSLDITDQVLHKKLIPVAEQLTALNALKDKLFTVFSHDIRNPMANMVNLVSLLEEDEEYYSDDNREIFVAVKEQVIDAYKIIENLLDWLKSQKEGLIYEPLVWDLSMVVQEMMKSHYNSANSKEITISSDIVADMNIFVDKDMLEIVLRNVLSNAVKFTGSGGSITIQAYEAENETVIAIHDTGKGMDYEKINTLFSEAYAYSTIGTAGEKGIGLGLLICKEFMLRNGGLIWAESTLGKGSTFYMSIPAVQPPILPLKAQKS